MKATHEPLRIPEGWKGQERSFVIQIERLMEDIYNRLGILNERVTELKTLLNERDE